MKERSQVEESDRRWRGAIVDRGEQWQVEGSYRRWNEPIAGGGELWLQPAKICNLFKHHDVQVPAKGL